MQVEVTKERAIKQYSSNVKLEEEPSIPFFRIFLQVNSQVVHLVSLFKKNNN